MKKVNIYEAKARLSEYVQAVGRGERVLICRRNRPVAELRPITVPRTRPRPLGGAKGRVEIPDSFFQPLPDEFVAAFYGEPAQSEPAPSRVAERRASSRASRLRRRARR